MVKKSELGITSNLKAVPWGMFQMIFLPAVFICMIIVFALTLDFSKWLSYLYFIPSVVVTLRLIYTLITGIRLRSQNTKSVQGIIKGYVDTNAVKAKVYKAAIIELLDGNVVYYDFNGSEMPYPPGTKVTLKVVGRFCMLV